MFTGIVEELGRVRRIAQKGQAMVIAVEAKEILKNIGIGDSIAVNGVCLTVTEFDSRSFAADVMPETYRHTNLSTLRLGDRVNLERAMTLERRFGGHIVQGHVDTVGTVVERVPEQNAVVFSIRPRDAAVLKYIVPRGSIAVDGISLTVVNVTEEQFTVSIIPHTLEVTVLQDKKAGDTVNIEVDIIGKYVERLLGFLQGENQRPSPSAPSGIDTLFLRQHGFM